MNETELKSHLAYIAIGVRFRPNFVIEDNLGKIIDEILYSKDSFYNPQFFPETDSLPNRKVLLDNNKKNFLTISATDILLELNSSQIASLEQIESKFKEQVLDNILNTYNVEAINRVGYLRRYELTDANIADKFLKQKIDFGDNIQDVNLRFSKKLIPYKSQAVKEVNDYHNIIYSFAKVGANGNEKFRFSIDFQKLFIPQADYQDFSDGKEYVEFIKNVNKYNGDDFLNWFNKICGDKVGQGK